MRLNFAPSPTLEMQHWMMASGLDDHFVFRRPLTAEEIQKVMRFGRPPEETKK